MDYGIEYYENMLRRNSATAGMICKRRWEWVMQAAPKVVLDYGSGVGWFRAFRPPGVEVFSFDIGPAPKTGIPLRIFDVTCFWDVLEHIPDFSAIEPVLRLSKVVMGTVPLWDEGNGQPRNISSWKHFKPGEHLHYFTKDILVSTMRKYKFHLTECSFDIECPPREDILSFWFTRG